MHDRRRHSAVLAALLLIGLTALVAQAAPAAPSIAISDVRAAEGNAGTTAFTFSVSVSGPVKGPITVGWATLDGSAAAPGDYTSASGTLAFSKTAKTRTVTVLVTGDTTVEADETFTVRLSGATGASIADATGLGTIASDDAAPTAVPTPTPDATTPTSALIAVGADIACDPADASVGGANLAYCQQMRTSNLLLAKAYTAVLVPGDIQYENGALAAFNQVYDPSWGRVKSLTYPAPGNHEYGTSGAAGYFAYFGSRAGDPTKGWYSFDLGAWHVVALNSNCSAIGGCAAGSAEEVWLRADLAAHPAACTLAFWHHPRFSSGSAHGSSTETQALWQALQDYGAEVVLTGHEHNYERFAPQTATGIASATGLREFVVGTGGKNHYGFGAAIANSEVRDTTSFGILEMTLASGSYSWNFLAATGTFADSGTGTCH